MGVGEMGVGEMGVGEMGVGEMGLTLLYHTTCSQVSIPHIHTEFYSRFTPTWHSRRFQPQQQIHGISLMFNN